ncbi:MAG: cation:proton antiporter [Candidatus Altiarchaeota archaeon]
MEAINPVLVGFTGCLIAAFLLSELFNTLRYPRVLGYILTGIIFNIPPVRSFMLHPEFNPLLEFLSEVGVVFFLLLAGAEIDLSRLKKTTLPSISVGVLSFLIPMIIGLCTLSALGYDPTVSFILSLCLSVTAATIAVEVLMEYEILDADDGSIIVAAGMIDDLLGILALTLILALIQTGGQVSSSLIGVFSVLSLEYVTFFIIAYILGFKVLPQLAGLIRHGNSSNVMFTLSIIFGLTITLLSQVFGLSSLIGAFIAGLIINITVKNKPEGEGILKGLDMLTFGLIIPFFFISIGLKFDLNGIMSDIPLLVGLIFIALTGKYLGVFIAGKITGLNQSSINVIGLSMNNRGGIELVIALVAVSYNLITESLFSIVIAVSFITTFISLVYFNKQIQYNSQKFGLLVDGVLKKGEAHARLRDIK